VVAPQAPFPGITQRCLFLGLTKQSNALHIGIEQGANPLFDIDVRSVLFSRAAILTPAGGKKISVSFHPYWDYPV